MRIYCRLFFDDVLDNGIVEVTFTVVPKMRSGHLVTCLGVVVCIIIEEGIAYF